MYAILSRLLHVYIQAIYSMNMSYANELTKMIHNIR
jgi:hypothetical protein